MDHVTPKDSFDAFVIDSIDELRHAARLIGGDDATARLLLDHALARTAAHWSSARADDPVQFALDALDREAALWTRDDAPDSFRVDTPLTLADNAWKAGRRLRRRRRVRIVAGLAVAALVVGVYGVTASLPEPPPVDRQLTSNAVYPLDHDRWLLPTPALLADTSVAETANPFDGLNSDPTPLSEGPVGAFVAATQRPDGAVTVFGDDGSHRVVDAVAEPVERALSERSISFDGQRLALIDGDGVIVVGTDGVATDVETSVDGGVIDVAWYSDSLTLLVTGVEGSFAIDADTGEETALKYLGTDTAVAAGVEQVREFTSPTADEPMLRLHGGNVPHRELPFIVSQPWAGGWTSPPMTSQSGGQLARGCVPDAEIEVPASFGTPVGCVAVLSVSGKVENLLVLTDAHPPARQSLLAFHRGGVILTVGDDDGPYQRVLRWDVETGGLTVLAHLSAETLVAVAP